MLVTGLEQPRQMGAVQLSGPVCRIMGARAAMRQKPNHLRLLYSTVSQPATETTWRPAADVYRTKGGWLLKFELAGLQPDDVTVTARGSAITVSGVRRDETAEQDCSQYSMEISYSRFERTIHLPCVIEGAELEVEYRNGILLVRATI